MNKQNSPLVWLGVVALSAYGAYYGANALQKKTSVRDQLTKLVPPDAGLLKPPVIREPASPAVSPMPTGGSTPATIPAGVIAPGLLPPAGMGSAPVPAKPTTQIRPQPKPCLPATVKTRPQTCGGAVIQPDHVIDNGGVTRHQDPRLVKAVERMSEVAGQANVQRERWASIKSTLGKMPLKASIQAPLNSMGTSLDSAERAIKAGDAAQAEQFLDSAQQSIKTLDQEWERMHG